MSPPGSPDLRQQARREFAAFLANYSGNQFDLQIGPDQRIWLDPATPIDCPPLRARNLEQLAAHAPLALGFQDATYLDHNAAHPPALQGIDWGGTGFQGGAGVAAYFLGSAIDPAAHPDSFTTVEVRFDHTASQSAYPYLRLETLSTGGLPPQGRAYLYGGYVTVLLLFEDREVTPGARYDYRLAVMGPGGVEHLGKARVEVPITSVLAFLGVRLNPGQGRLLLAFSLASREPARVALLDVGGRRVLERDVTGLGPGSHTLALEAAARLPAGIYLVRIEQGGRRATGKAAIVR